MPPLIKKMTEDEAAARKAALPNMNVRALRREWVLLFGTHPYTTHNKAFLIKRLTWRINTLVNGGLSERALKRAEELADETLIRLKPRALKEVQAPVISELPPNTPVEEMPNGTIIRRKYKGKDHEVTVLGKNKFAYEGAVYDNLTAIAWKICGYPKSGNYFFNLPMGKRDSKPQSNKSQGNKSNKPQPQIHPQPHHSNNAKKTQS